MSHPEPPQSKSLRALLLGPAFPDMVGGLQLALRDVVGQLTAHGWTVDEKIWVTPSSEGLRGATEVRLQNSVAPSRLAAFQRWPFLWALWERMPATLRKILSISAAPRQYFKDMSHNFYVSERWLDEHEYDVVLFCIDCAPPGLGALLTDRLKNVVVISLQGLGAELQSRLFFVWGRLLARIYLQSNLHPFVFRQVRTSKIPLAIMASAQWYEEAIRAGLTADKARTIYFGIPVMECSVPSSEPGARLLWVGRMTKEKGLHLLLQVLPAIRQQVPSVTLTIISGPGPIAYRRVIDELVVSLGLIDIVTFLPSMTRDMLRHSYASHDVLFFHSVFSEPVALVLMEAFAVGLPVVANSPRVKCTLVQDQVTCLCYAVDRLDSLRDTVVTMLTQPDIRVRLAARAQQLVREEFSMHKMGRAYDEAMRWLVSTHQSLTSIKDR